MAKALIKILCLLAMATSTLAFLSSMCDNKSIGSRIAFPMACEKFIVCGEGARVASVKTCPSGLHFNAAIEECDLKTKAGCERSNFWAAADTCDTSTCCACCDCSGCTKCDNDLQYCVGQPDGVYPYPLDCTQYIRCINECTTIYQCPDRTLYLYETGECGDPCKAVCPNNPYCPNGCANGLDICANSTDGTQIPNPNQCGTYYVCKDKCAVPEKCRPGELFNPDTLRCEEACRVKCPGSGYPCTNGCTNGSTICENQADGTELPNPNECGSYYVCKNKCPETRTCDEGQLFNPLTLRCEEACNVNCPGSGYPCSGGCEGGSEICKDIADGTQFPNDNQCGWFYECKDQCPVPGQCPFGQLFNPETRRCEQACNVNCPGSGYPCSNCSNGLEICANSTDGTQIPNPNQCGTYYVCKDKCAVPEKCRPGELFNPDTLRCEEACRVKCPGSGYPCTNGCTNGSTICENQADGTELPNPNECGSYYVCKNKCPETRTCDEGQLFNPLTLRCEEACNVNCPGSGYPCGNGCEGGSTICENQLEGVQLPNPEKCGTFFICRDKCPVNGECPEGLLFNPATRECEKACTVDCPGSNYPCENKCENGLDICENSLDGTLFPNYNECGTYFECQDKCPRVRECRDGLLFNPVTRKCEKSCNVNCPGSGFPCSEECANGLDICREVDDGTLIPNYSVCGTFFVCDQKCPVPRVCPEGELFNPETLRCVEACLVDCPGSNFPCTKCENGLTACVGKPDGFYPYPNDCTRSIECTKECATINTCRYNTLWDNDRQQCVNACETNCPNNPYPCFEGCPEGFEICKDKPFGSYQPIPEDCSLFVVCDDTCEDIRTCAEGLLFNPKTNRCDTACAVDCPGSGYPCANPPPAGPSGHACDSPGMCVNKPDGTLFKDPNTNGYIVCQCECEIPRPCPDGLIFNQNLQTCDWPPKK